MPSNAALLFFPLIARALGFVLVLSLCRPLAPPLFARAALLTAIVLLLSPAPQALTLHELTDLSSGAVIFPVAGEWWAAVLREGIGGAVVGAALVVPAFALVWVSSSAEWLFAGTGESTPREFRQVNRSALAVIVSALWMLLLLDAIPAIAEALARVPRSPSLPAIAPFAASWSGVLTEAVFRLMLPLLALVGVTYAALVYFVRLLGSVWPAESGRALLFPLALLLLANLWPAVETEMRALRDGALQQGAASLPPHSHVP